MPKSRRDKRISLTRTKKKGLETKQSLIEEVRDSVDKYARIVVFSVENMRNSKIKDVRNNWKHSRFFFGKNKVMMVALGKTPEEEYRDNLHRVSKLLIGNVGLLFTNQTKEEVVEYFEEFVEADYARSGNVATETVTLFEGPLEDFQHSMEPQLRQLRLPTVLKKGVIHLTSDHTVCNVGDTLTPEQARILKLFAKPIAEFKLNLAACWSNDGTFKEFRLPNSKSRSDGDDEDED
nr:mRNA turnover protein 4 homolog [Lytechinus pictus]